METSIDNMMCGNKSPAMICIYLYKKRYPQGVPLQDTTITIVSRETLSVLLNNLIHFNPHCIFFPGGQEGGI